MTKESSVFLNSSSKISPKERSTPSLRSYTVQNMVSAAAWHRKVIRPGPTRVVTDGSGLRWPRAFRSPTRRSSPSILWLRRCILKRSASTSIHFHRGRRRRRPREEAIWSFTIPPSACWRRRRYASNTSSRGTIATGSMPANGEWPTTARFRREATLSA